MSSSGSSLGFWLNRLLLGNITDIQIWMPFPIFCFRLYNKIPPAGIFQIFVPETWFIVAHKYNIRNTQVQNEKDTHTESVRTRSFVAFLSSLHQAMIICSLETKSFHLPYIFFLREDWNETHAHVVTIRSRWLWLFIIVITSVCFFCTDVVLSLITHNHTMV